MKTNRPSVCDAIGPREALPGAKMFHNLIWDLGICSIELYNLFRVLATVERSRHASTILVGNEIMRRVMRKFYLILF